jgi:methylated-DNA-[protein]-cysteine S-methyltransferase
MSSIRTRANAFTLFETAVGTCGVAWTEGGIAGTQLPEETVDATRTRLRQRFPNAKESAPTPEIAATIERIVSLLGGTRVDLRDVVLDMAAIPAFERDVFVAAREIPAGSTKTYGEIAKRIGHPTQAREVGVALARNPFAIIVPCHRVVAASGALAGHPGGDMRKRWLLRHEGAPLQPARASRHARGTLDPADIVHLVLPRTTP